MIVLCGHSKVHELERELNRFKAKFVTLLSDKFKVVVPSELVASSKEKVRTWLGCADPAGAEDEQKAEEDEAIYQEELLQLLQKESDNNDVFNYKSSFKDEYGDWHHWESDTTVKHYLCRQLYLHYTQQVSGTH